MSSFARCSTRSIARGTTTSIAAVCSDSIDSPIAVLAIWRAGVSVPISTTTARVATANTSRLNGRPSSVTGTAGNPAGGGANSSAAHGSVNSGASGNGGSARTTGPVVGGWGVGGNPVGGWVVGG